MFQTKSIPLPSFEEEATIIVSSLSPQENIHTLTFEEMHEIRYKQLKKDLNKVLSPKKLVLTPTERKIKTNKTFNNNNNNNNNNNGKITKKSFQKLNQFEPTLYTPPLTREFSLSPKVKSISPSELVLLREQHSKRMNQVELHANSITSLPSVNSHSHQHSSSLNR